MATLDDIEQKLISRSETMIFTELDDETIMMDPEQGQYFGLDDIATRVWGLLQSPRYYNDLCDIIKKEYRVTIEQCKQDLAELILSMHNLGIIKISS